MEYQSLNMQSKHQTFSFEIFENSRSAFLSKLRYLFAESLEVDPAACHGETHQQAGMGSGETNARELCSMRVSSIQRHQEFICHSIPAH